MRTKPTLRWTIFWSSALLAGLRSSPAQAQQLLAWPIGQSVLRALLPGMPIRPLPPHPRPLPRPQPTPAPVPQPAPIAPPEAAPMTLSGYRVEGAIDDQVANLTYHITFQNPTNQRLEGVLIVPIPANTVLSGFSMSLGGKMVKGELLEAGQASTIYENIVRSMRDPGLLELIGERLFRARVFPIEPHGQITAQFSVTQVLPKSGGLLSLTVPLKAGRMTQGAPGRASARIRINASKPLRALYSPNPRVEIRRDGERRAEISYESGSAAETSDLSLFYSLREDPLAAGLLSFQEEGEDGYFLLSLSPRPQVDPKSVLPKDIVFVVDRSGSMEEGGKMGQARKALAYCLGQLGARDRFGIVDFATDFNSFEPRLVSATPQHKARGLRYVETIEASGGTNIEAGLSEGLKLLGPSPGRVPMVFFLTDGLPTVGETDVQALLRKASSANAALKARLFSFGVGSDVNTLLLDKLSEAHRGARDYVAAGEDIEHKVSSLYQKVAKPALTDLRLEWRGLEVAQVTPKVSDLFYGSELILLGRYRGQGRGSLVVTGQAAGKNARFEFPVEFAANAGHNAFLPRLWANFKVAQELDAIRLSGRADPEVVNEIVRLAKRHGIVTPYTSYLVTEEGREIPQARHAALRSLRGLSADAAESGFSGGSAVAMKAQRASGFLSRSLAAAPKASTLGLLEDAERDARQELADKGASAVETRSVAGKTFYLRSRVWVDGDYELDPSKSGAKRFKIAYLGPEYFGLLKEHPELSRYLALGSDMVLLHQGVVYEITDKP